MSEGASQGPESLGPPGYGGYHHSAATHLIPTPSSTFKDEFGGAAEADSSKSGLPPFSSFSGEGEGGGVRVEGSGFTENAGSGGSRLLDLSNWDYYNEGLTGRLLERGPLGEPLLGATSAAIIAHHAAHQAQYRPWESKSHTDPELLKAAAAAGIPPFSDAFGGPKLPSFQSQFTSGAFAEPVTNNGTSVPPSESTPGLPSFHTLTPATTVPPRGYPLVPAPVQAREIPAIQQQLLDERHIQLFHSQPTFPPGANHQFAHHPHAPPPPPPHLAAYHMKPGDELKHFQMQDKMVPGGPHSDLAAMGQLKFPGMVPGAEVIMPQSRLDSRKKERRKTRVSSLESSADSDITNAESSGQVAAVSSTGSGHDLDDGFRRPSAQASSSDNEMAGGSGDKPVKKKRKRCGECVGCQRKDNCGECAPCRNEKSHQICKMRRCEKLTEKKVGHAFYY
ncbi:hypothetical protein B566_EDAN008596 [Ephemera danica]|nr:hypothetical protein B566_EDAN008596 [Ephemera danica]